MSRNSFTRCDVCRKFLPADEEHHFNRDWHPINKWHSTAGFLCCDPCWQKIPEADRTRE